MLWSALWRDLYGKNLMLPDPASKNLRPAKGFVSDFRNLPPTGEPSDDSDPANTLIWKNLLQINDSQNLS